MCHCTRRLALKVIAAASAALVAPVCAVARGDHDEFIAAAFRMKDEAVRAGDQAYGAVVARDRRIIGFGPSRVVLRNDQTAHAEREALREAQARIGSDLFGCILYSSSRPCSDCERAAATANISRMYFGRDAVDAGPPRRT